MYENMDFLVEMESVRCRGLCIVMILWVVFDYGMLGNEFFWYGFI